MVSVVEPDSHILYGTPSNPDMVLFLHSTVSPRHSPPSFRRVTALFECRRKRKKKKQDRTQQKQRGNLKKKKQKSLVMPSNIDAAPESVRFVEGEFVFIHLDSFPCFLRHRAVISIGLSDCFRKLFGQW